MKLRTIFTSVLALAVLASCSKDPETPKPNPIGDDGVAYISLKLQSPSAPPTKGSSEEGASTAETTIHSLYAVAFDQHYNIICYDTDPAARELAGFDSDGDPTQEADPFRVSSGTKYLLLVANPGAKLKERLDNAVEGENFNDLNVAVTGIALSEIMDATNGFTMINVGRNVAADTDASDNATLALDDITDYIEIVGEGEGQHATPGEAENAAKGNRATIKIERLTAKIIVGSSIVDGDVSPNVIPANTAVFTFDNWVLDATNSTFYPWTKTVELLSVPSTGGTRFYEHNFYTMDPNYLDDVGIEYKSATNGVPPSMTLEKDDGDYVIENTMKAHEQRFKNATRVVIRGFYHPTKAQEGTDWFRYGTTDYADLDELQAAYAILTNVNLRDACERFWGKIEDYAAAHPEVNLIGTDFASLEQTDLDQIKFGGELVKEDKCIRWFQKGLCYYWYEIRHDIDITGINAFAKYGVVRNNMYNLTLSKVGGPGTPWYPEIKNPEPGEPDPGREIDEQEGYIGVTVTVGPWVSWQHPIEV